MFGLTWIDNGADNEISLIRRTPEGERVIMFPNVYYAYVEDMNALGWWNRPDFPDRDSPRRHATEEEPYTRPRCSACGFKHWPWEPHHRQGVEYAQAMERNRGK